MVAPGTVSVYPRMRSLITSCLLLWGTLLFGQSQPGKPDDSRFTKIVLDTDLNEPMEVDVAADGTVFYIERPGWVNRFDPRTGQKKRLTKLPVRFKGEDGLMGMALDPNFAQNRFVYLYFGEVKPDGDTYLNVLARFEIGPDSLLQRTRRDLLRIPVIPEGVSHSGGSLAFDGHGNLYLSTGDNTNPFESGGYAPVDGRADRLPFDAQKSAGNTNDLRGKILRIHPTDAPDNVLGYTIPAGNLFPVGTDPSDRPKTRSGATRPEIFVMGCRNPFRINIDLKTNVLYWGEVGPDAGKDSLGRGPRGHDEFNRAAKAGNFGWPYFVGNSKPYHAFDFASGQAGKAFDPLGPLNQSANNTGIQQLPPVQPALIWYPYDGSPEFPALGTGGRNAIGGPIYHAPRQPIVANRQFPADYEGAWFIADWMRNWLFTARVDSAGKLTQLEPFLANQSFSKPIDMTFGPDGAMYLLEYGAYWRAKNTDARLIRIEYNEGNRPPVAKLSANKTVGAAPLTVRFSASGSFDYDPADSLTYQWHFTPTGKPVKGKSLAFTFTKPGTYPVAVTVSDGKGGSSVEKLTIRVGNEPPTVKIALAGNRSFYFDKKTVDYAVQVTDREDGNLGKTILPRQVKVTKQYLPTGSDFAGLDGLGEVKSRGQVLLESSDCLACHAKEKQSVGPSLVAISRRYDSAVNTSALEQLTQKVIAGGGGVWGKEHVMSAHPQLSQADAGEMVQYILNLNEEAPKLATKGSVVVDKQTGQYLLRAQYADRGGLSGRDMVLLRSPRLSSVDVGETKGIAKRNLNETEAVLAYNEPGAWVSLKAIDLTGVGSFSCRFGASQLMGSLDLHLDSPTGPVVGTLPVVDGPQKTRTVTGGIRPTTGQHDLYLVYKEKSGGIGIWKRLEVSWIEFSQQSL